MTSKELEWAKTFMRLAFDMASHSKCRRLHVGAVIVKDKRVISTGYNGTPTGMKNCDEVFDEAAINDPEFNEKHRVFSAKYDLHAELNACIFAHRDENSVDGCDLYLTHAPCSNCAKLLVAEGIKRVFYFEPYDRDMNGPDLLNEMGVHCECLKGKLLID
jgi:dCMP deaminase